VETPVLETAHQSRGDVHDLQQVPHSISIDTEIKAVTTTRADSTIHVAYHTGESLVMWPDGSRTTNWSDGTWVVEIPGLPCVHGKPDKMICEVAPDAEITWQRDSGSVALEQRGVCSVLACSDGAFAGCMPTKLYSHLVMFCWVHTYSHHDAILRKDWFSALWGGLLDSAVGHTSSW
jgi:hypothetical protein